MNKSKNGKNKSKGKGASRGKTSPSRNSAQKNRKSAPTSSSRGMFGTQFVAQPVQMASILRQTQMMKFGAAGAHENYPDGGMRISGSASVSNVSTTAGSLYLLGNANRSTVVIAPNNASVTTNTIPLLASTHFGSVTSVFFRQWIARYIRFRYLPGVGANGSEWDGVKEITLAYDMDAPVQAPAYTTTMVPQELAGSRTVTFTPSIPCEFVCVPRQKQARDDQLQWTTGVSDSIAGTTAPNEVRTLFQGGLQIVGAAVAPAGSVVLGVLWVDYEFDLYGFTNLPNLGNAAFQKRVEAKERDIAKSLFSQSLTSSVGARRRDGASEEGKDESLPAGLMNAQVLATPGAASSQRNQRERVVVSYDDDIEDLVRVKVTDHASPVYDFGKYTLTSDQLREAAAAAATSKPASLKGSKTSQ